MRTYWLLKKKSFMTLAISHNQTNRKPKEAEKSDWTIKNGGKSQQEVLKKCCLHKLKKKQSIFAFLNKLAVSFFCAQLSEYFFYAKPWNTLDFVHYIVENPGIFITQMLENSEKYPGKPLKTLQFELKTWLSTLYCHKIRFKF